MSAMPDNVVPFQLPKKPRILQKDPEPWKKDFAVVPWRAIKDDKLHGSTLRTLIALCAYCNRAGITWVGRKRLADDLAVSHQAVSKQIAILQAQGYVEVLRKGFRGERTNTLRVIYDPSISAEDAMANTSSIEDTRPPAIKHEQERQADPEGQRRIAQLLATALKGSHQERQQAMARTNPQGDTITVRKMKQEIAEHQAKRRKRAADNSPKESSHTQPSEVAHEQALHLQPDTQPPEVARKLKEDRLIEGLYKQYFVQLQKEKISFEETQNACEQLSKAYEAEGLELPQDGERLLLEVIHLVNAGRGIA
jgi:biotin operon repressor